jgi:hypothetical protein
VNQNGSFAFATKLGLIRGFASSFDANGAGEMSPVKSGGVEGSVTGSGFLISF